MAWLVLSLLLQTGLVVGSSYGYVEWSDNDRDADISRTKNLTGSGAPPRDHRPTYNAGAPTERVVVAHKIEEDLPRVVTAFLHTGDSSALKQVNCSRRYELSSLRGGVHVASHYSLHSVLDTMAHAANLLNTVLQANRSGEHTVRRDVHWYHALVRSILEADPKIHRAVVTFHSDTPTQVPRVFLQATRTEQEEVVLQDLSHLSDRHQPEWIDEFRDGRRPPHHHHHHQQRVTLRDSSHYLDKKQIKWSAPYLECEHGRFVPYWLLSLSAGFFRANSAPEFRGVVRVDVNLQGVDIDQCSSNGWFAGTHRCNLTSMECTPIGGHGFVLDKYRCQCRQGFYHPSRVALNGFTGKEEGPHREDQSEASTRCLPCRESCPYCRDDAPCLAQEDGALRLAVASLQSLCLVLVLGCMGLVYRLRRSKRIRTSGLILLEAILFGAQLLYSPVMVLYFPPSVFCCLLLRWVRVLGFAIMYGTVVLKLYRVLKVFLSRTAQRTPYMTSWRVLRLLAVILLVVLWFLVAWTSAACQSDEGAARHHALVAAGRTPGGLLFSMCLLDRWDYMMAVAEFLFLLWGVYLCYAVRTVPSAFHEPRYMAVAIYNELLISAIFHIIRFSLAPGLHPDWMLILFFAHTHLTVTVTLGLLLVPKFLSTGTQARDDIATEAYDEELDMGRSGSYLNSSITSAWSEHSLDPEDIRDELKKLYAQLEVYKRKKMLANNPHLQKKRSSKKGLGRSLMRRITEIPESVHVHVHRQCSREEGSGEHGGSHSATRRNPFDPTHHGKSRDDSLKSRVLGLKKSHSYDHTCDQSEETASHDGSAAGEKTTPVGSLGEGSLLGSLIGRKQTRKSPKSAEALPPATLPPRLEPAESTESVPLFWKSASAHNLTHDKKPVHLRTSIMQKSLSVIASAKEKMPGLAGKTQGAEDASKKGVKGRDGQTLSGVDETPEHYPKMIISQSVEYSKTAMKMGIMKQQVSGSQPSICSEPGRNLYDLSEVCPWELEEAQTPPEGRSQKHVSIAPEETALAAADHHAIAVATRRGSGSSGAKIGRCLQKQKAAVGPSPTTRRRSRDKAGEREDSREARKPRLPLPLRPDVRSWDLDGQQPATTNTTTLGGADAAALSPDRARRKKSVTPTDGKPKTLRSDHSRSTGSLLQPPFLMGEVCPWDYHSPPSPPQDPPHHHHPSSSSSSKRKRKGSSSSNHRAEKDKERSRERRSSSSKPPSERRRVSQSSQGGGGGGGVGGGGGGEGCRGSAREAGEGRRGDVCLRDTDDPHASPAQTKSSPERKTEGSLNASYKPAPVRGSAKMADVCPWDFEEQDAGK